MDPQWLTGIGTLVLAVATFALAILAALGMRSARGQTEMVLTENERIRKEERQREQTIQATDELSGWIDEAQRILYLPREYYAGRVDMKVRIDLTAVVLKNTHMIGAAVIIGREFVPLTEKVAGALNTYYEAIENKSRKGTAVDKPVAIELHDLLSGLQLYLNLFRSCDYNYDLFMEEARKHKALPLVENLIGGEFLESPPSEPPAAQ